MDIKVAIKDSSESNPFLQNPIIWQEHINLGYFFEIELSRALSFLPSGVVPITIRPNVCVVFLCNIIFPLGNLGKLDAFEEIDWAILVQPNLHVAMPEPPRYCLFVGNIASSYRDFLDHAYTVDKMPIYHKDRLQILLQEDCRLNRAHDDQGNIFNLNPQFPSIRNYIPTTIWGQNILLHQDQLYLQVWRWEGNLFEYQKDTNVGQLYNHAVFRGLDVSDIGSNCYLQFYTDPSQFISVTFYEPVRMA